MKLDIADESKAVEKLGIHIKNFDGEIAENSSFINLTYNVLDLERQLSSHLKKIRICLLVIAYACFGVGATFISVFTWFYVGKIIGKKLGYEARRKFYSRYFISGAHLIIEQIKDPHVELLESDDEVVEIQAGGRRRGKEFSRYLLKRRFVNRKKKFNSQGRRKRC